MSEKETNPDINELYSGIEAHQPVPEHKEVPELTINQAKPKPTKPTETPTTYDNDIAPRLSE